MKLIKAYKDSSMGKGTCLKAWKHEFDLWTQ